MADLETRTSRIIAAEATMRWVLTAGYAGCTIGLMWTLGVSVAPWLGLLVGAVMSGIPGARLWSAHLDVVQNAVTRADVSSSGPAFTTSTGDGGASMGVGPGRDDVPHPVPDRGSYGDDDEDGRYP